MHITDAEFRQFILSEIVARCIKNNLRWKLREKMKQIALPLEEPYRRLVIDYLNVVFGNYKVSDEYWDKWLKQDLLMNFEGVCTLCYHFSQLVSLTRVFRASHKKNKMHLIT